ncbi:hypothetical protein ACUXZZ_45065 (plasmid) [Streptomyces graminifolii]|uniref:hypothetical protein n=1 Tax=Streptomyces graminifolii TaxID=1266771 RepID=UPI004057CD45
MASRQATGVAGGSTKHTQNQPESTETEQPHAVSHPNDLGALTPEQVTRLVALLEAQQEAEQVTAAPVDLGHSQHLSPAQLEGLARLRDPFPVEAIAKRPQINCEGCKSAQGKVCSTHSKSTCKECGQYVTTAHKHLDYVGHAEATDRLLSVDPTWDWEPMATDDKGRPLIDHDGGMWITLTVCGLTRKGYGDAVGKRAGVTATKEVIGDAIRNAGMRFGMALDLWAKTDLHAEPPSPAEPFVDAIKTERVWTSTEWLSGVRREADEAGQLDFVMPRGGGKTLGDVIDAQLLVLEDAARRYAEARIKQDEEKAAREAERAAMTAQVAAERGVRQQSGPPAQQASATPAPANPQGAPEDPGPQSAEDIRDAWGDLWQDPDALERLWEAARSIRVANAPASLAEPRAGTIGQALKTQINALRQGAPHGRASAGQPSGAVHEYADQHGDWGYGDDTAG